MANITALSDEELLNIAGVKSKRNDISALSDSDLLSIAGVKPKKKSFTQSPLKAQVSYQPTPDEIKYGLKQENLTPEYKAKIDKINAEKNTKNFKAKIGAGAMIASPLITLATGGLSLPAQIGMMGVEGGVFGLGSSLMNKGKIDAKEVAVNSALGAGIGGATNLALKGARKFAPQIKKTIQSVSKKPTIQEVATLATNPQKYVKDIKPKINPSEVVLDTVKPQKINKEFPVFKDNYLKNLSEHTHVLHREMSPDEALNFIGNRGTDMSASELHFSNDPDLALGQGNNKGIVIKLRSDGLQGKINTKKPTWKELYSQNKAEFIAKHNDQNLYKNNVESVTIKPNAKFSPVETKHFKNVLKDWSKTTNADGSITYTKPNLISGVNLPKENLAPLKTVAKGTSKLPSSVSEGKAASDELKFLARDANVEYNKLSNKELEDTALNIVKNSDSEKLVAEILGKAKPDALDNTMAFHLSEKLINEGKSDIADEIISATAQKASEAGQTVQAFRLWSKLTPTGAIRQAERMISEANKKLSKNAFGRVKKLELTQQNKADIVNLVNKAKQLPEGSRERNVATAELLKYQSELIPAGTAQKLKTFRNISLLLNPKTLVRNIAGNTLFNVAEDIARVPATLADMALSPFTGKRTRVLPNLATQLKGFGQGAKEGFEDAVKGIDTVGNIGERFDIPMGKSFRGKYNPLNYLETALNVGLKAPDRAQYTAVYNEALDNILKASGKETPTQTMIEQAKEEALQAVFQDDSVISQAASKVRKGLNVIGNKDFGAGDLLAPYVKTPANLANQGINYSPVGLVKGAVNLAKGNQRQATMDFGRALTGTGLIGAGYLGAKNGLLNSKVDSGNYIKDRELLANQALIGERPFTLNMGNTGITYNWAQPMSTPIIVGSSLAGQNTPTEAVNTATNAIFDLPFTQGLQRFGQDVSQDGLATAISNFASDIPSQFIPTGLSQINQLIDNRKRETYSPNRFQQGINRAVSRVPLLSNILPQRVDVTGQPMETFENGSNTPFNVLLNPAFVSQKKDNPTISNLLKLQQDTGESGQLLPVVPKKVKINGENRALTPNEFIKYQELTGKINYDLTQNLFNNPEFTSLPEEEQVKVIQGIQKDANTAIKYHLFGNEPKNISNQAIEIYEKYLQ